MPHRNKKPQLLFRNEIAVSKRGLPRQLPEGCRARWLCVCCAGEKRAWSLGNMGLPEKSVAGEILNA